MHLICEASINIEQSCMNVFDYISNMENFSNWFPEVVSITSADSKTHGKVGKKYRETVNIPFRGKQDIELCVVESIPGEFFSTIGQFKPLLPKMEIKLIEKSKNICQLTWKMYSRNNAKLIKILLLPIAKLIMQKRAVIGVHKLKDTLENKQISKD